MLKMASNREVERRACHGAGMTLIETLITISIIGLLLGLILPAIQSSREAASRLHCANNLKQIGIALQSYVTSYGFFPSINSPTLPSRSSRGTVSAHNYSPLARILAQLDQWPMYNSVNFVHAAAWPDALVANHTVMLSNLELFLCSSDSVPPVPGYGRVNYRFCLGPTPWKAANDSVPDSWAGPFTSHRFYRPSDFHDGLTNTIGASERLQGDWLKSSLSLGDYLLTPISNNKIGGGDRALSLCAQQPRSLPHESRSGESWFLSGFHFTDYNHCATPNALIMDCGFLPFSEGIQVRTTIEGVFTARSNHPGGVNGLMMDGGVRFVENGINITVWRALSTRSGNELIIY